MIISYGIIEVNNTFSRALQASLISSLGDFLSCCDWKDDYHCATYKDSEQGITLTIRIMATFILFLVVCLFFAVFFSMNTAEGSLYASHFDGFSGYRVRNPYASIPLSGVYLTECCLMCLQYQNCYSVNIQIGDRFCEMNMLGPSGYGDLVDKNDTWTLFIRTNVIKNELMFRATSGVGLRVKDTWLGKSLPSTAQDKCLSMENTSCSTHYRNPRIDIWESLSFSEVTLELYKHGSKVAFITFDGKGSTIEDWFNPTRITKSSWSDVTPSTIYNFFSIKGHADCSRSFFVNKGYQGCDRDHGWMVVIDSSTGCCPWGSDPNYPQFLYSAIDDTVVYQSGSTDLERAEVMAVFVKYN